MKIVGKLKETQLYLTVLIIVAALMHVFLAVYFFTIGLFVVGWVNVGDVLIWCVAFFINKSGKIKIASFISMLKIITYSLAGSILIGLNVNVQWIILAALPPILLYLDFTKNEKIFLVTLMLLVINLQIFIGLNFDAPFSQDGNTSLKFIFTNFIAFAVVIGLVLSTIVSNRLAALQKKEIEKYKRESHTDSLTKLSNRRYADVFLQTLLQEPEKLSHCIAILDIDNFKLINDRYGHDTGDSALIRLSEILRENTRSRDLACRWGGEEFLLILYRCSLDNGLIVLERIRKAVEETELPIPDGIIRYTVTIGAAILDSDDVDVSIRLCDNNLYKGKQAGKNKVVG